MLQAEILLDKEIVFAADLEAIFGKRPWISRAQELLKQNPVVDTEEADTPSTSPSGGKKEIFIHEKEEEKESDDSKDVQSDSTEDKDDQLK